MSDTRPVWLTEDQRDALASAIYAAKGASRILIRRAVDAWDAAPADPTDAVMDAMLETQGHCRLDDAQHVLSTLGMPSDA